MEPWLRGTLREVPAVQRAVVHALELAREDVARWVWPSGGRLPLQQLSEEELLLRPYALASVAFQVRHISRSLDRLLTYAEGGSLSEEQMRLLRSEEDGPVSLQLLREEFQAAVDGSIQRVLSFSASQLEEPRAVGRAHLPTTLAGLLVHGAEHTQRHVGQTVTAAKVVIGLRAAEQS